MGLSDELDFSSRISKMNLLNFLKREANSVHMSGIMMATTFIREDAKYMQAGYREDYIQNFSKAFIIRLKDIKEDSELYEGFVDTKKLQEFLAVIDKQRAEAQNEKEICFLDIASIIATYTTFIREESIHPVGTKFPGGLQLKYENGQYVCPVKEKQKKNPSALCRFCVSVQDANV
jgi:uncharacterized protein (UPF0305 family)